MALPNVEMLAEGTGGMTFAQGLAFIERMRRQLDRYDRLPDASNTPMPPEKAAKLRRMCDELEANIMSDLSGS